MGEVMAHLRERVPEDAILTNGAGNFSVWAHRFYEFRPLPHAARADERRDGLRRPGRGRGEAPAPRADRGRVRRRRGLPDDRAGARDRRAVRRRDRRAGRQQRHVRDDPDAPGAPLPGPRVRDRSRQPRFRCTCPGVRRASERSSSEPTSSPRRSKRALQSGTPALVELRVDPEALTPRQTLSEIREAALGR